VEKQEMQSRIFNHATPTAAAETGGKFYFMQFLSIEKVHRNSIKITVDLAEKERFELSNRF
jgi:hypothetical protein